MSNDFLSGRTRANGSKGTVHRSRKDDSFWGNDSTVSGSKQGSSSSNSKANFISAQTELQNLIEELNGLVGSAANTVSGYAMSIINGSEAPSQNHIEQNLATLVSGFTVEQQRDILLKALAKVAVNA